MEEGELPSGIPTETKGSCSPFEISAAQEGKSMDQIQVIYPEQGTKEPSESVEEELGWRYHVCELFHVSKLADAICQRTSSYTSQMRHLVQIIALSSDEIEYRGTCSHQHNIGCDRCNDLRQAIMDIQVALSHLQLR